MNKNIIISSDEYPDIVLKMITVEDIEKLRVWKNKNADSFFYKEVISSDEQVNWYNGYLKRNNDFMFSIYYGKANVSCIGFRVIDGLIDIYNVILGEENYASKGIMKCAMIILVNYLILKYDYKITAKVLKSNSAINWYKKNGFLIEEEIQDYFFINFDKSYIKSKIKLKIT